MPRSEMSCASLCHFTEANFVFNPAKSTRRSLSNPSRAFASKILRTDASNRSREIRPDFTATCNASNAASGTGGINSASAPANTARTAASPGANRTVIPPMSIASVITSPSNPNWSRRTPVKILCESVAGIFGSGSSAGTFKCPVITLPTPASIAARKGTNSNSSSRARSALITGRSMCESAAVSPCPGKCFAVASPPFSFTPRTYALTNSATRPGFSPNDRVLMIGFSGLLLMSATGA